MHWKLFSATWLCAWRRLRPLLGANPLVALIALAAVVAIPPACAVVGARLADDFVAAAAVDGFRRALGLSIATTGLVVGTAFALLAPRPSIVGGELAAAPVSRRSFVSATVVVPTFVGGLVLSVPAVCFLVALGGIDGVVVATALGACMLLGAVLGEGLDLCVGRERVGAAVLGAVGATWIVSGGRNAELGPGALVAAALGDADSGRHLAALLGLTLVCAYGWRAAAAQLRPATRVRGRVRALRLPRSAPRALGVATVVRLARHPQLVATGLAAVALPLALGGGLSAAFGVDGAPLVGFGVGLALTAASLLPAAAQGLARDFRWLRAAAPIRPSAGAFAAAAGGVAAAAAAVAAAGAAIAPFARAELATYVQLEAAIAFVLGCAAFSGALVPWRPDQVVQQLAAYGSLVAVAVAAWALASRLEPIAVAAGLSEPSFGLFVGNAILAAGVAGAAAFGR